MDILHRFALIIHWFSFIVGTLASLSFMYILYLNVTEVRSPDGGFDELFIIQGSILIPFSFVSCAGLGWLFRFVISGKIHFLPWKKLND